MNRFLKMLFAQQGNHESLVVQSNPRLAQLNDDRKWGTENVLVD